MSALLTLGGGFLLAVVWMDLMFDVQALRGSRNRPLDEPALASIANYYLRVTTDARTIAQDHVACFAAMLGFVAIQLFAG